MGFQSLQRTEEVSGVVYTDGGVALTVKRATLESGVTGTDIVAAVAGRRIRVLSYSLQAEGTVIFNFADTGNAALYHRWSLQAREGEVSPHNPHGWFETALGKGVQFNLSLAIQVNATVVYVEVP